MDQETLVQQSDEQVEDVEDLGLDARGPVGLCKPLEYRKDVVLEEILEAGAGRAGAKESSGVA